MDGPVMGECASTVETNEAGQDGAFNSSEDEYEYDMDDDQGEVYMGGGEHRNLAQWLESQGSFASSALKGLLAVDVTSRGENGWSVLLRFHKADLGLDNRIRATAIGPLKFANEPCEGDIGVVLELSYRLQRLEGSVEEVVEIGNSSQMTSIAEARKCHFPVPALMKWHIKTRLDRTIRLFAQEMEVMNMDFNDFRNAGSIADIQAITDCSAFLAEQALVEAKMDVQDAIDLLLSRPEAIETKEQHGRHPLEDSQRQNLFRSIAEETIRIFQDYTKHCFICEEPLPLGSSVPTICGSERCIYGYQELGLGVDIATAINRDSALFKLQLLFFKAATVTNTNVMKLANSDKPERCLCYPFEVRAAQPRKDENGNTSNHLHSFVLEEHTEDGRGKPDFLKLGEVLDLIPPMDELCQMASKSTGILKEKLIEIHPLMYPLLFWIVASNRSHFQLLPPHEMLPCFKTEFQYKLTTGPMEKESEFQRLKASRGSRYGFHGSCFANWHLILRAGLKNFSMTKWQTNGAAHGSGVYIAKSVSTAMRYSGSCPKAAMDTQLRQPSQQFFPGSHIGLQKVLTSGKLCCIAVCEYIKGSEGYESDVMCVIPDESHVVTRFFIVNPNPVGSVTAHEFMQNIASGSSEQSMDYNGVCKRGF